MGVPRSSPQCHARLTQAIRTDELVRVRRALPGADVTEGFVVQLGPAWVLLSVLREGRSDGWTALRTADVQSVEPAPSAPFVQRGLQHRESWPPHPPHPELDLEGGLHELLESASAGFDLFLLHREQQNPSTCWVGRLVVATPTHLEWLSLSPDGAWETRPESLELASLSRIDLGSQYALALARAAELRLLVTDPNLHRTDQTPAEQVGNFPKPFRLHALP